MGEAAVQDADKAVAEGSEGLVVGGAAGPVAVVASARAGGAVEGAEGLVVEGVGEAAVPGVPGQDDPFRGSSQSRV